MISRRSFLVGLGGLLTTAFVAQAREFALDTGRPLLLDPGPIQRMLLLYEAGSENRWLVSIGQLQGVPDTPSWAEFFRLTGHDLDDPRVLAETFEAYEMDEEDLDDEADGIAFESWWEHTGGGPAQAYILLKDLGIDCSTRRRGEKAGRLEFCEFTNPMSCDRFVELADDLTVSVLQARLLEAGHRFGVTVD